MYHSATSFLRSRLRFLVVFATLLFGMVEVGYGQRVYADASEVNCAYSVLGCLNGVQNHINAIGENHNTYSSIIVSLTGSAWQSLRFTGPTTPTSKSPITIKFQPPAALLSVLGGIRIQKTNGPKSNLELIGTEYSDDQLLDLLGLLGGGSYEFQMPAENYDIGGIRDFDGIRLFVSSTLGLFPTVNYFYAFFITPPQLLSSSAVICQGESATITLSHFENGYKYRVYPTEIGGTHLAETASSSQILLPVFDNYGSFVFWVEAVDSDTYVSARVPFTITVVPHPGKPHLSITSTPHQTAIDFDIDERKQINN